MNEVEIIKITDKEFADYKKVKASGKINMIRIAKVVEATKIPKEKIWFIMRNYDNLKRWKGGKKW